MIREIVEGNSKFKKGDEVKYKSGSDDRIFTVDIVFNDSGWRYDFMIKKRKFSHGAFEKEIELVK